MGWPAVPKPDKSYEPGRVSTLRSIRDDPSLILDRLTDGFLTVDSDWRLCFVNQAVETRTGLTRDELIGQRIWDVLKETAGTEFERELKLAYETQTPRRFEHYYGVWDRWFENRVYPADDGVSLLITDITGKKQADARLKAEHAITRILAQAESMEAAAPPILEALAGCLLASIGEFWVLDPQKQVLELRDHFPAKLNGPSANFVRAAVPFHKGAGLPGQVWEQGAPVTVSGCTGDPGIVRARVASEAGIQGAIGFPIYAGDEFYGMMALYSSRVIHPRVSLLNMLGAVGGDIGLFILRNRAELALQESEKNLRRRAEELQGVNQELESFSYSVSHDLRSPLRAMDMSIDMLEEDCGEKLGELGRSYLEHFRISTRKMNELIEGLLRFGRLGRIALMKETVSMASLARSVWEELSFEEPDRQISFHLAEIPSAEADEPLIRQVFSNLLSNALKYSRPRERTVIEIGSIEHRGVTAYFVRDNGVGFDGRYANKLFKVFQRLHPEEKFEGAGIGLAMVGRIIQRHGGSVWAESHGDDGATFYFTLANAEWDDLVPKKG
jgi:PAS domain S-box-containing protein